MLAVVFRRHLRAGVRYEDYVDAWRAEKGYGVKARVLNATSLDDEREVLTVGFVGISTHAMKLAQRFLAHHDNSRHDRIADVIDADPFVVRAEVIAEQHVAPEGPFRSVRPGSRESMLHLRHTRVSDEPSADTPWLVLVSGVHLGEKAYGGAISAARIPPSGVDKPAVLIDARGVDDGAQLLSVLFVKGATAVPGWSQEWIESGLERPAAQASWRGAFEVRDEHDFRKDPIAVPLGSDQSVLSW